MPGLLRFPPALTSRCCHAKCPHAKPRVNPARRHPPGAGGEPLEQSELLGSPAPTLRPVFAIDPTPTVHRSLHALCTPNAPPVPL